jgi:transcriptional regulator with XRE-family HTH domain
MKDIPAIDMTATGLNITRLRIAAGLTVRDLQAVFGFNTPQAIYKWQHGTALPTLDNLVVLAGLFGVTVDEIIVFREDLTSDNRT